MQNLIFGVYTKKSKLPFLFMACSHPGMEQAEKRKILFGF